LAAILYSLNEANEGVSQQKCPILNKLYGKIGIALSCLTLGIALNTFYDRDSYYKMTQAPEQLFTEAQQCEKQNDWSRAIDLYRAAIQIRPDFLEAHHNLAVALRNDGQAEIALKSAQFAAALAPDHPTVQFSLGVSLEQVGHSDEAINAYTKSVNLRPSYIAALSNLGRLLEVKGRLAESIEILERALALAPSASAVLLNLANSALLAGNPQRTTELLKKLIENDPNISEVSHSLASNSFGVAAHVMGERAPAIAHFREAIATSPDFAEAHENLAQALLFEEEYEEAWLEYEWRWLNESNRQSKRRYRGPIWQGEKLAGQILLVHAEQGFGDVIQFVRLLSLIDSQGGKVILACHAALIDLFSALPGIDSVVDIDQEIPPYDAHVPLLSLPRLLNISGTNIPNAAYLAANSAARDQDTSLLRVGIAWAGMPRHEFDPHRNRSCPVEAFEVLKNHPKIALYSLQTGPNAVDLSKINGSGSIIDLNPQIQTFRDTADLISSLDLVITIDTALAHLAGSMGKNVWILLATCADWRWLDENQNNPWYPTSRLFRQKTPGNWDDPLHDVVLEIQRLIP
jgi:tetratricopeptide (TPR) repeat protein